MPVLLRPFVVPSLFLVGVWLTVVNKRPFLPYLLSPRPFYPQGKETAEPSREAVLQSLLLSVNRTTAFELGQLAEHLREHGEDADCVSDDRGGCKPVLERATELVGSRDRLTADEMWGIGHLIKRGEEEEAGKKMIWERVRGLFSFVNVMWALAILGIACSLGPVVYYLLHPLATVLLTLARAVWQHLVYPLLLLSRPLFELLAYYICLLFIVHGHCIKEALDEQTAERRTEETALRLFHVSTSTVPVYVALTGCMLAIPAFIFSLKLHSPPDAESKYLGPVLNGFLTLMLVPVAVALDSQLLGFLAIWTLFGVLGAFVRCYGLCWCIGWESEKDLARTVVFAFCFNMTYIILRVARSMTDRALPAPLAASCRTLDDLLSPFGTGLMVLGSHRYYLGMLILCSRHFSLVDDGGGREGEPFGRVSWRAKTRYMRWQGGMVASLLMGILTGSFYGIESLKNTAITFLCLYLGEKGSELPIWGNDGVLWCGILAVSVGMWRAALWLHQNPQFLIAMIDPNL
ncbi:unnamed protein product [Vitrella brassicaformis CCMP3155]|uniref:Uncharacterized protein n=1 Tax=Vitrella brassicaformis (strain CCMP3155) TaxID=1169540 RepID=A0A0G4GU01_VITBC|nr:unnamed protein product [Vitrella brassicaformis CCMP3155]|eukprot:CEM34251.1 unnamed protein product [Vitrella brassicaformis CCMP3155]